MEGKEEKWVRCAIARLPDRPIARLPEIGNFYKEINTNAFRESQVFMWELSSNGAGVVL
jgi:hypothetical protein